MSRWMIEQTAKLLDGEDRERLLAALEGVPLDKPADHKGGLVTDMFVVAMPPSSAERILRAVEAAAALGGATAIDTSRGLRGFVAAWREYVELG